MLRQSLLNALTLSSFTVGRNTEGVSHEMSLVTPQGGGSSMNWVLGHLIVYRHVIFKFLGIEPIWEGDHGAPYKRGTAPSAGEALPWTELLSDFQRTTDLIRDRLTAISDTELAKVLQEPGIPLTQGPTATGVCVGIMLSHDCYHAGQLGVLRRMSGLAGAIA